MRKLNLIAGLQKSQVPNLGILTTVEQLSSFDMIYIYHHIQVGNELTLKPESNHYLYKNAIQVWFKGFKLGYLSDRISTLIAPRLSDNIPVNVQVKNIAKAKYLPFSGLDIEIKL